jgi:4-hydroxy-2-oxoheptanedioate aldolase
MIDKAILKKRLQAGEVCLGTWVFIPSPALVEIIALAKFDFIIIDMEHSPISLESAIDMMNAAENRDMTPIIRASANDPSPILRVLDSGAHGVQVPHIESAEDARKVVEYSKYHPIGSRGMAPNARAGGYTYAGSVNHPIKENEAALIALNVEGVQGIKNLPEILEVEHIDVIFLGPFDLSQSVGVPGQIDHPEVLKLLEQSIKVIRDAGKAAGCFAGTVERGKQLIDMGVQYLTYQADGPVIREAFENIRADVLG